MLSTDGMSKYRLTPYKPTIIHDNCYNYNSGSSSTLILDVKLFIVEQLTQLSDNLRQTVPVINNSVTKDKLS